MGTLTLPTIWLHFSSSWIGCRPDCKAWLCRSYGPWNYLYIWDGHKVDTPVEVICLLIWRITKYYYRYWLLKRITSSLNSAKKSRMSHSGQDKIHGLTLSQISHSLMDLSKSVEPGFGLSMYSSLGWIRTLLFNERVKIKLTFASSRSAHMHPWFCPIS